MSLTKVSTRMFLDIIRFNLGHDLKQPILGLGAPGIGKSEMIKQIANEFGYEVEDIRLAQMSAEDMCGLIFPDESKTGTQWLIPDWFPRKGGPKTILLLDELTSATKRVQVAAYQLVLDRKLGRHNLPEDTVIIALGNRAEDKGVYVELAAPLANRFEIYDIYSTPEIWLEDYANIFVDKKTGATVNPYVISYIQSNGDDLAPKIDGAGDEDEEMVFATPRSWKRVSDTMNAANSELSDVVRFKIRASIGDTIGNKFIDFCQHYANSKIAEEVANGQKPKHPTDAGDILFTISALRSRLSKEIHDSNGDLTSAAVMYNRMISYVNGFPGDFVSNSIRDLSALNSDVVDLAEKLGSQASGVASKLIEDNNEYNRLFEGGEAQREDSSAGAEVHSLDSLLDSWNSKDKGSTGQSSFFAGEAKKESSNFEDIDIDDLLNKLI